MAKGKAAMILDLVTKLLIIGLRYGPEAVEKIRATMAKDDVTLADWEELIDKWEKRPEDYLRDAGVTPPTDE
jgi:hypothetical protein